MQVQRQERFTKMRNSGMQSKRGFLGLQPTTCRGCQTSILVPVAALLDGVPQECPRCSNAVPAAEIEQSDPALRRVLQVLREESSVRAGIPFATAAEETRGTSYRFYLLDAEAQVGAEAFFPAGDDRAAREIAASVYDACADVFRGYELWREETCLATVRHKLTARGNFNLSDVVLARQRNILDLEDRLQSSFSCVSKSKRLLAATAALRAL